MKRHFALFATTLLIGSSLIGCKTKEEVLNETEASAKFLAEKKARLVKGVGEALEGEGKAASEALAKGSAQVARGVETGAIDGFSSIAISVGESLTSAGVKAERAAIHREDTKTPQVKAYLVLDKPFKGDVTMIARTQDGKEVGRSKLAVDEQDTGKYFVFSFDPLVDLSLAASLELK